MADRAKATRGRKRTFGKNHPPPSAADLFDSLIQGQDKTANEEPKTKKSKSLPIKESELGVSSGPKGGDVDSALGQNQQENSPGDDSNKSPFPRSDDSDGSEDDGPCVLMSFGNTLDKDNTDSPEQSPRKLQRGRRPKADFLIESTGQVPDTPKKEGISKPVNLHSEEDNESDAKEREDENIVTSNVILPSTDGVENDDATAAKASTNARRNSDAGGVGSLGVSKDVEDSIRKEIENMLANNRFRGGARRGEGGDRDTGDVNGDMSVSLEEDVILVEAGRKKHCRFLIRRQEDQTPPSSRNYRCFKCSYNTTRMNNMIRHYRQC
ncbi:uncharacterized protein LOC111260862 isoform X2 [Varroa jacobsoni]|uniref:Uncharacterized protein n=1 Tax=Varroa destructor TaxID=109461 RepID=A0A7M7M3S4_VARDE|nr:uncharacterized protein LOC111244058 isoform X2 [Varroa destructor]XP_022689665.1 uncharacterized protein LOC111260862 isoform X2 [Varroa jacobsoni]